MPLTLPLALRLEKNKLTSTAPWLVLAALTLPDTSVIRLVANTDDIVFDGETYLAWSFELGEVRAGGTGRVEGCQLRLANPERALVPDIEANGGCIGCPVSIQIVHADNLAEDHSELRADWQVLSCTIDGEWVTFGLGAENPFRRRFPLYVASPNSCGWIFKGIECAYAGSATECNRTLARCRELSNSARFGARPGIAGAPRFA